MSGTWIDTATGAPPAFPLVDQGMFDAITSRAVEAGANKGQELIKSGITRGRSQWRQLSNWTILLRIAQNRPSTTANLDTGDYFKAIQVQPGGKNKAEVGLLSPKGPKGQDMLAIARVMEGGATIRVTEKMRGFFASHGLHLKPSTTHILIPPRPVFGTATPEMDEEVGRLMEPYFDQMEALFVK